MTKTQQRNIKELELSKKILEKLKSIEVEHDMITQPKTEELEFFGSKLNFIEDTHRDYYHSNFVDEVCLDSLELVLNNKLNLGTVCSIDRFQILNDKDSLRLNNPIVIESKNIFLNREIIDIEKPSESLYMNKGFFCDYSSMINGLIYIFKRNINQLIIDINYNNKMNHYNFDNEKIKKDINIGDTALCVEVDDDFNLLGIFKVKIKYCKIFSINKDKKFSLKPNDIFKNISFSVELEDVICQKDNSKYFKDSDSELIYYYHIFNDLENDFDFHERILFSENY